MPHIPFRTASPVGPLDDLAPFLELAATRTVIGLGEATHGTREVFQLKHRLIRALAEGGGLRTVAFECGLAAGRFIDDYVRFGRGTAREALTQQGYWCWENHEVLTFIEWLGEHNSHLPPDERIAFAGIDVQKIEPGLPELLAALASRPGPHNARGSASDLGSGIVQDAAQAVQWLLEEPNRGDGQAAAAVRTLTQAAPVLPTPELRALCRNAARYVDTYLNPEHDDGLAKRDEYLAATALEILAERPGLMVVWAHNEHVAINPDFFGTRAMGHHLREALGNDYLALGMLFDQGAFLARTWGERSTNRVAEFRIGRAGEGHVERSFAGRALGIIDTATAPTDNGAEPTPYRRFLGNLYDHDVDAQRPDAFRIERPLTDFDLIAWLPNTHAARYLRAPLCQSVGCRSCLSFSCVEGRVGLLV